MTDEKEEWDGPWKEALDHLGLVFALFWPDVLQQVDLDKGCVPLQQELQKLTPDSNSGLLRVDKLFELVAKDSGDPRIAHFEAQMQKDEELPWRMYRYGRRGGELFNQPLGRFAILGDDEDPKWKPTEYREGVLGCEDVFTFRIVKLSEWRERMAELEAGDNLFGLFLCAHLETMATRGKTAARQEAKFRLLANLLRRDLSEAEVRCWYRLIDWIMKLPEDANRAVWLRLEALKEPKVMTYIPFAERYYMEQGAKEGRKEGIKEGVKEGVKESLRDLLLAKFPAEGLALFGAFEQEQDVDRLKFVLRAAGLAQSSDDFRARLASAPS